MSPADDSAITAAHHVRIAEGEAGQRIDNFLLRRAPGVPKSHVYQLIRRGEVRVDGRRIKPTRKLVLGEQVRVPAMRLTRKGPVQVPATAQRAIAAAVVYEHADFLVLDKPPGMAVHGGSGLVFGAIDALRQTLGQPSLELVHRLDRGTSGALLVARDPARCRALQTLFRERTVDKRYRALLDGAWPDDCRTIDAPLLANREHAGERRVIVSADGQPARTHVDVRRRFASLASEVSVRIETGRTHQIRVHTRSRGHAVIGDERYGDNRRNARFKRLGLARLCLHAESLRFDWHGESLHVQVPPDARWDAMCEALERSTD